MSTIPSQANPFFAQNQPKKLSPLQNLAAAAGLGLLAAAAPAPTAKAAPATDTFTLSSQASIVPQDVQAQGLTAAGNKAARYQAILQRDPFAPKKINIQATSIYPDGTPMEPAVAPKKPVTEKQFQKQIAQTLMKRARLQNKSAQTNGQAKISPKAFAQQGLDLFNDPALQGIDPKIRALYAILPGTSLEGAVASFKEGVTNGTSNYRFGPLTNPKAIAQAIVNDDGTRDVVFNERYQYEDIRQLAPFGGHEELHKDKVLDQTDGEDQKEELIAHAFQSLTHLQFLKESPNLALQKTELARRNNTLDMAMINTRNAENGSVHILNQQRYLPVFPGSPDQRTYYGQTWVDAGLGADTPGNAVLDHAIAKLEHSPVDAPVNFDDSTLNRLDAAVNGVFTPKQWVTLAQRLWLDTSNTPGVNPGNGGGTISESIPGVNPGNGGGTISESIPGVNPGRK